MIQSMTGFGESTIETENSIIRVEIKTLNSKFLDIYCRIPKEFSSLEIEIRQQITQILQRGKIECTLIVQSKNGLAAAWLNPQLITDYLNQAYQIGHSLSLNIAKEDIFKIAISSQSLLNLASNTASVSYSEDDKLIILSTIKTAIQNCTDFRIREGKSLEIQILENLGNIVNQLENIQLIDNGRIPLLKSRLQNSLQEITLSFDVNRLEQEIIYYIEKLDISEEKTRLKTHLNYFKESLKTEFSGKKLGFIAQEIGREINTIGSKANDAQIQHHVVQMKDELEKIKEQVLNLV